VCILSLSEDRGWCLFYLLTVQRTGAGVGSISFRGQRLVFVLSLTLQRTEVGVGSITNSAEDRGW
jgi:hypothetical protein